MKRASISLSVNFIVVLIIALSIMGIGFSLLRTSLDSGAKATASMQNQLQKQMQQVLASSTEPVLILPEQVKMEPGDIAIAVLGIRNMGQDSVQFTVNADTNCHIFDHDDPSAIPTTYTHDFLIGDSSFGTFTTESVARLASVSVPITIELPKNAAVGLYVCTYEVNTDTVTRTKLYINVA